MKINRLAVTASPGGALSRSVLAIARTTSKSVAVCGGNVQTVLSCLALITASLAFISENAVAAGVNLAWNANPETNITGYRVSYGITSGVYPNVVNVGTNPTTSISGLADGTTYYFAVSAVNKDGLQSSLSSQISYQTPVPTPNNQAPIASASSVSTNEDTPLAITLKGTDPENSPLTYSVVTSPSKGTLSGTPPKVTYLPAANYNGTDSFTFRVNDGTIYSAVATISISVTSVNDVPVAQGKSVTTTEDTPVAIILSGTDPENSQLTFSIVSSPTKGTLSGTAPNLTYSPAADANGNDSFTYRVNDGTANSTDATVSITVTPVNDAPVASSKSVSTTEDTPLSIVLGGSDKDLNSLTFSVITGPSNGTLTGTPPNLSFTPAKNFNGSDQFTFRVNDGIVNSPLATISIVVSASNDAPVALASAQTTAEDTPLPIVLGGTDIEGATLKFTIVNGPTKGSLSGTPPNVTYSPATNYNGPDSFTFLVNDGASNSQPATVSLTVTPVNDAPVANSQSVETPSGSPRVVILTGSDPDGNALTFAIVTSPAKGTLSGTPPNLSYQPNAGATGSDQFTFRANDGSLTSPLTTVAITITPLTDSVKNLPPVFTTDPTALSGSVGVAISGQLAATDPNPSDVLTFTKVSGPAWLAVSSSGALGGVPQVSHSGINSFVVRVTDNGGASSQASLNITVTTAPAVNHAPTFISNPLYSANASENAAYSGQSLEGKAVDSDPGDTIIYWKVSGPAWLNVAQNGQLSGTPPAGSAGMNSFLIRAADPSWASVDTELRIYVDSLPLPWRTYDLGIGQVPGSVSHLAGTFIQKGSGALGGISDKTSITYQTISGDGSITAKISLEQNSGPACYAGIMIRDSLSPKATEVFLGLTNDSSFRLVSRTKSGRKASVMGFGRNASPDTWVKLARIDRLKMIFAFKSTDGVNWTYLGATRIAMPSTCYIGLAVSSGSDSSQTIAKFSNLYVDP